MNLEAEPLVSAVVNMIVGLLVSKGIIDSSHASLVTMDINNILAAFVTVVLGGYSIYKTVEAYKHKVTLTAQLNAGTNTTPVISATSSQTPKQDSPTQPQTGLPLTPNQG